MEVDKLIKYREARHSDFPKMLDFYKRHFKNKRTLAYYSWAYIDNPMGSGKIFLALDDDKIIGTRGFIAYRFIKSDKPISTYKGEDSLVDTDYRGKGIFKSLSKFAFDQLGDQIVWDFNSDNDRFSSFYLPAEAQLTTALWVSDKWMSSNKTKFSKQGIKELYSWTRNKIKQKASSISGKKTEEISSFDVELEIFSSRLSKENPLILFPELSSAALDWRLQKNESIQRFILLATKKETEEISDLFIIAQNEDRYSLLSWYYIDSENTNSRLEAINGLLLSLTERGIHSLDTWFFDMNPLVSQTRNLLEKSGFVALKKGLYMGHNTGNTTFNINDLYYCMQMSL